MGYGNSSYRTERERDAEVVHTGMIYVAIYVRCLILACEPVIPDPCQSNQIRASMGEDTAV